MNLRAQVVLVDGQTRTVRGVDIPDIKRKARDIVLGNPRQIDAVKVYRDGHLIEELYEDDF